MAAASRLVVSNALCFLTNKFRKDAIYPLKSLLADFYSPEDIAKAKDLLIDELDIINSANLPKITRKDAIIN